MLSTLVVCSIERAKDALPSLRLTEVCAVSLRARIVD